MIIEDRYLVAKKKTNTYRHVAEKWSRYVWVFFGQTPVVKTVIPEEINIDLASFTSENGILMLNGGILPQPISKRFK